MRQPVCFVDWFVELSESEIRFEVIQSQSIHQILVRRNLQIFVQFFDFRVVGQFVGVSDVRGQRLGLRNRLLFRCIVHPWHIVKHFDECAAYVLHHLNDTMSNIVVEIVTNVERPH